MTRYSDRYVTPSPNFPKQSPTSLARLLAAWEALRERNLHGYRTSQASPPSTWLVKIQWGDGHHTGPSVGRGTTCSPFTTQASAMAYSPSSDEPIRPVLADGTPLPVIFSHAANGVLRPSNRIHKQLMDRYGMTMADNEWPRPIIFFNMGHAVEPEQLRRGDAVHIDWMSGGGHAVFCWDVHLNDRGEVDAFSYVSSNGRMPDGGHGGGVSVGGTASGAGGIISSRPGEGDETEYFSTKKPLFADDERYVVHAAWVTWDDSVAGKILTDLRARPTSKVTKVKRIAAARFHGIDPAESPLFAMGQDKPGPYTPRAKSDRPAEINTRPASTPDDVKSLQRQLKLLYLVGWIGADPGGVDGKPGKKTTAAVVAFQRAYGLKPDGKLGPLTLAKLDTVFRAACNAPQAKPYLNPGQPSGLSFATASWEEGCQLYFRHGAARPGETVPLVLCGSDLPQHPLRIVLLDAETRKPLPGSSEYSLQPLGDRATLAVTLPAQAAGRSVAARVVDAAVGTDAPIRVVAAP